MEEYAPDYVKREASGVQISDRGILKAAAWLHEIVTHFDDDIVKRLHKTAMILSIYWLIRAVDKPLS